MMIYSHDPTYIFYLESPNTYQPKMDNRYSTYKETSPMISRLISSALLIISMAFIFFPVYL